MIVHADVDAFFASVVRRDSPRYRGVPFVVGQEVVVACASYEARALGIHAGMPLARVRRQWPEVSVAPPAPDAYRDASAALFALFRRYTPLVEPGSLEEAFLDMTGRLPGDPARFAAELRRVVRTELGLPVSELHDDQPADTGAVGGARRVACDGDESTVPPRPDRRAAPAAERLLAETGYEDDGRGVRLVGVTLFLSTRPAAGQLALPLDDG